MKIEGRRLTMKKVEAIEGTVAKCDQTVSFLGDVDPDTGIVTNRNNNLYEQTIKDKIFAFRKGSGSTVGPYTMLRLQERGSAPRAILMGKTEPIIAVGAVISDIPLLDEVDVSKLRTGQRVRITGGTIELLEG